MIVSSSQYKCVQIPSRSQVEELLRPAPQFTSSFEHICSQGSVGTIMGDGETGTTWRLPPKSCLRLGFNPSTIPFLCESKIISPNNPAPSAVIYQGDNREPTRKTTNFKPPQHKKKLFSSSNLPIIVIMFYISMLVAKVMANSICLRIIFSEVYCGNSSNTKHV